MSRKLKISNCEFFSGKALILCTKLGCKRILLTFDATCLLSLPTRVRCKFSCCFRHFCRADFSQQIAHISVTAHISISFNICFCRPTKSAVTMLSSGEIKQILYQQNFLSS